MTTQRHTGRASRSNSRGHSDGEEEGPALKAARIIPDVHVLGGIVEGDEEARSATIAKGASDTAGGALTAAVAAANLRAVGNSGGDDDEEARSAALAESVCDLTGDGTAASVAAAALNAAFGGVGGAGQGQGEGEQVGGVSRMGPGPDVTSAGGTFSANAPAASSVGVTAAVLDTRLDETTKAVLDAVDTKLNKYLQKADPNLKTIIGSAVQSVITATFTHFETRLSEVEGKAGTFAAGAAASMSGRTIQLRHAGGAHGPVAGASSTTCWGSIGAKPSAKASTAPGTDSMES